MSGRGIKNHPLYPRMKVLPPAEVSSWVLGQRPIEEADKGQREETFRHVANHIMSSRAERTKYGFNSDTNGEIARAMEWAFQAGLKAAGKSCTVIAMADEIVVKDGQWPEWKRTDIGDSGDCYELLGPDGERILFNAWGHNIYDPPSRRRRSSRPFVADLPDKEKDLETPGLLRNRAGAVRTFPTAAAAKRAIEEFRSGQKVTS